MHLWTFVAVLGAGLGSAALAQDDVRRVGAGESPISASVELPMWSRLVYVSGTVPDPVDTSAPQGSVRRYGDTATQTRSVLRRIERQLAEHELGLEDIVMMRVFLVAPPGQSRMDFAGMMTAYREFFGTSAQPMRPARSTMQVAGLVDPGWLVEIEVTAATPAQAARAEGGGGDDYALIDEADALAEAIGEAPPDYEFAFDGDRPWAWEGGDGWLTVAETLSNGVRHYYFAPGQAQPFLVREPGYSFGYRDGDFVIAYDASGRILTAQELAARQAVATARLDRARRLAATARRQREAIETARWLERRAQMIESRQRWEAARARQRAWRDYRARAEAETRRRRLDTERDRRREEARRFDERQRPGGRAGTRQVTNQPPRRPPQQPPVVAAPTPTPPANQTGSRRPTNPRDPIGTGFQAAPEDVVPIGPSPAELERQRQAEVARRAELERRRQAAEQAEARRRQQQAAQAEAQRRQQEAAQADARRQQQEAAQAEALRRQQEAQARAQAEAQAQADAQTRAQAEAQAQAAARARAQAEAAELERRRQEEEAAAARRAAQQQQRGREVEETQPQ